MSSLTDREQRIRDRGQKPGRPDWRAVPLEDAPAPIAERFSELGMRIDDEGAKVAAQQEAERAVPIARSEDERALGAALRSGERDPGAKSTERAVKAADEARRQSGGARVACDAALEETISTVAEHGPAWLEAIAGRRVKAHAAAAKARELLDAALAELQAVAGLEAFVLEFPDARRYRPPISRPVLAEVDEMLEQIGPRREEPRELYLREENADLEVAEAAEA
jgi:hypothetical protein